MFHLLKMVVYNVWRKFKYYFIYLSSLFFIYVTLTQLLELNAARPKSSVNLHYVAVHLDLKGSPPKITYLASLLPILSIYGVNAILMEYEDMFPYMDSIANISSANAYKRNELLMFINSAKNLKIEIIPLIQTFGHMEFVLKWKEFAHLRELKNRSMDICPSNPESRQLITTMLKQVIDMHALIYPLQHIHVGCDEVRSLNVCPNCKKRKLKNIDLFVDHVNEVSNIVNELNPAINVLMWSDMLLDASIPKPYSIYNVEAVTWDYRPQPQFSHIYFYNLHKNFNNIWIASAFKGADGNTATIPNIRNRFRNHLSWMNFILGYRFGGEKKVHNFKGIILTGWSRYTHTAPQCELLPVSMPSLILNLLLIKTVQDGIDQGDLNLDYCEFYKKYLNTEFSDIFRNPGDTDGKCAFENTYLYVEHEKLFDHTSQLDCLRSLQVYKKQCQHIKTFMDLEETFAQCEKVLENLLKLKSSLEKFMPKYYKEAVISSYIHDTVQVPAKTISGKMKFLQNCTYKPLKKIKKN